MRESKDGDVLMDEQVLADLIDNFFVVLNALDFMVYQAKSYNLNGNDYVRVASVAIADTIEVFYLVSHNQMPMSRFKQVNKHIEARNEAGKKYVEWLKNATTHESRVAKPTRSWHLSLG